MEWLGKKARRSARGRAGLSSLVRGIGDDCAVIAPKTGYDLLITTDLFLEGVHFRRQWQDARSAGHKVLARGLSDMAAMGGVPLYVFLSLGLPRGLESRWAAGFFQGFFKLAQIANVILAGGDTGRSRSGLVADIVVVGEAPQGQAVLRSGARPGDQIWVTGTLGLAADGLAALEAFGARARQRKECARALRAFLYPQPRLRIGRFLSERKLATAMMDLSDGLSIDLARLCEQSKVSARLIEGDIPHDSKTPLRHFLHGGEDLELLFTVPPERSHQLPRRIGGVRLTRLGEILPLKRRQPRLLLTGEDKESPLPVLGFQHF